MIVEWEGSPAGDMIADAAIALLMHAQSSAASIRLTSRPCRHSRPVNVPEDDERAQKSAKEEADDDDGRSPTEVRLRCCHDLLKKSFKDIEAVYDVSSASFEFKLDAPLESGIELDEDGTITCNVKVEFPDERGLDALITVECKDKKIASNIQTMLRNLARTLAPIPI